jgi:hypothetical protein
MFACVLAHEVAHGYSMSIAKGREPLWSASERQTELGCSWEMNLLGHVPIPSGRKDHVDSTFHEMMATEVREIPTFAERAHVFKHLKGGSKAEFTGRDARGKFRNWPNIDALKIRGASWSFSHNAQGFATSIHIISMHWMVSWFQQDVWASLKQRWAKYQMYAPLPLGKRFMIIYERGNKGAQVHRPLYPNNAVDAEVLRKDAAY